MKAESRVPPPLLDPARRELVRQRVREIARELSRPHDAWTLSQRPDQTGLRSVSLALGRSGTAVFEAWLYRSGLDDAAGDRAVGHLQSIIELLPSQTMDLSLLCGFPGVAWTVEHLAQVLELDFGEDVNAEIDTTILEALEASEYEPAYDLIDGLAGLVVYALQRRDRKTGPRMLDTLLGYLEEMAQPQSVGLSWPSGQITRAANRQEVSADENYFNLGLSHGVPGAIASLARLHAIPELRDRVTPLLAGATEWLCAQRLPGDPGTGGMFPDYVSPGAKPEAARLAWCYGDPGVAAALASAAIALGREPLFDFALDVARAAASRADEGCGVVDDGLCHGTAGLVQIFHRFYRLSGDEACKQAALRWLDRLLERKEQAPHIAGFTTFCFERTIDGETIEDPAWLTGVAGVGLVLLSALTEPAQAMPDWDRPFLLDLER